MVARWAHNPKVGGSNPSSATKKKPCCDSNRALLFSDRQKLAFVRDGNNKARSSAPALQGFFFVKHPQNGSRDPPDGGERNPSYLLPPNSLKGA